MKLNYLVVLVLAVLVFSSCAQPAVEPVEEQEVGELQNQITALRDELSEKEKTIEGLQTKIAEKSKQIEELEAKIAELEKPEAMPTPGAAIMAEPNTPYAGSFFVLFGSNFKPHEPVRIELDYPLSQGTHGYESHVFANEEGVLRQLIDIRKDAVPGVYQVRVFVGEQFENLLASLPIRIEAALED